MVYFLRGTTATATATTEEEEGMKGSIDGYCSSTVCYCSNLEYRAVMGLDVMDLM